MSRTKLPPHCIHSVLVHMLPLDALRSSAGNDSLPTLAIDVCENVAKTTDDITAETLKNAVMVTSCT